MAHVDGNRCRWIDVQCACCSQVTRIQLDPDAHAREKAALRAEIARLYAEVDAMADELERIKLRLAAASGFRSPEDAERIVELDARVI